MVQIRKASCFIVEELESRTLLSTFHVAQNGNDNWAGSSSRPWGTLQHAADTVAAGDTVRVQPGHYVGFQITSDGTPSQKIRFIASSGTIIDRPNSHTPDGINLEGADYVIIQGFRVVEAPRAGIRSVINHHVSIRHNQLDSNGRWGVFTGFSDDLIIEHNLATRSQVEHGIYVSNSADRPIIRNNVIWGNNANGIHMNGDISQGGDGIISNALVERNLIYENGTAGGSGINADGVQDSVFQNNLIRDNHASGISLYQIDGGAPSINNLIVNNTIVQARDARWAVNIQDGSTGNRVLNNVLVNHHSWRGSIDISTDSLSGFESNYNVMDPRFTLDGGDSVMDLGQWRIDTGQDANSVSSTPDRIFMGSQEGNYHLARNGPAIDIGTSLNAPGSDMEGRRRPNGLGVDAGAFEYSTHAGSFPSVNAQPDFWAQLSGSIVVRTSARADRVQLIGRYQDKVRIVVNDQTLGEFVATGMRIVVYANRGNDTVTVRGSLKNDVVLVGGAGDDILIGSSENDVILGADGNDKIIGGAGDDVLIGGLGRDIITGRGGRDILVTDSIDYAVSSVALGTIVAEWTSSHSYSVATRSILFGEGNTSPLNRRTVHSDSIRDVATGGGGLDWTISSLDDRIRGKRRSERCTLV